MPVRLSLTGKNPATVVRQIDQNLKAEVPKVGKLKLAAFFQRVLVRMRGDGKKISYPVKWDSERQRRWYFATHGKDDLPYKRTGAYQRGWTLVEKENGMMITNKSAYARYVGGSADATGQSSIHDQRWVLMRDSFDLEFAKLPGEMQDAMTAVARRVSKRGDRMTYTPGYSVVEGEVKTALSTISGLTTQVRQMDYQVLSIGSLSAVILSAGGMSGELTGHYSLVQYDMLAEICRKFVTDPKTHADFCTLRDDVIAALTIHWLPSQILQVSGHTIQFLSYTSEGDPIDARFGGDGGSVYRRQVFRLKFSDKSAVRNAA